MKEYRTKAVKTIKALRAKIDAQAAELKAAKSILESKDLVAKQAAELGATSGGGDNDAAHLAEKARLDQRVEDLTKQVMVLSEVADVTDIEEELARVQAECAVQTERALKYKTKSRALKEQLAGERAKQSSGASPAEMEAHATVKMELGALKQKLARAQNSAAEVEPLRLALREKSDAAESSAEALRAAMSAERRAKASADEQRRRVAQLEGAGAAGGGVEVEALRRQNDALRSEQEELRAQIDALDSELLAKENAATLLTHELAMSQSAAQEFEAQMKVYEAEAEEEAERGDAAAASTSFAERTPRDLSPIPATDARDTAPLLPPSSESGYPASAAAAAADTSSSTNAQNGGLSAAELERRLERMESSAMVQHEELEQIRATDRAIIEQVRTAKDTEISSIRLMLVRVLNCLILYVSRYRMSDYFIILILLLNDYFPFLFLLLSFSPHRVTSASVWTC